MAGWGRGSRRSGKKERVLLCLILCYVATCIKLKKCTFAFFVNRKVNEAQATADTRPKRVFTFCW